MIEILAGLGGILLLCFIGAGSGVLYLVGTPTTKMLIDAVIITSFILFVIVYLVPDSWKNPNAVQDIQSNMGIIIFLSICIPLFVTGCSFIFPNTFRRIFFGGNK